MSIIQFSSAARINQSSLRCLLFANNFSLLLSNSFELFYWRWNFTVFLVSCLSSRITLRSVFTAYGCCCRCRMPLLRPASIRIMLISVSSFKIIQINCGIYLGSFFPLSETHKELNSRGRLTKNDQNINTLMHISLFGLDHLLLFLFLLPHLGSAAVPKLSHKVWADADWFLRGTNFASIRSQIVSGTSFDNGYLHLISLAISSAADFFPQYHWNVTPDVRKPRPHFFR